jgi:hypothetical protein
MMVVGTAETFRLSAIWNILNLKKKKKQDASVTAVSYFWLFLVRYMIRRNK